MLSVREFAGVVGDGQNDDADGLQAALDTRSTVVYLPPPRVHYLVRSTLQIHSGQTLLLDRHTVIRLADQANRIMLTNSEHHHGNKGIALIGGLWDGNNANQTREDLRVAGYDPSRYIGVAMRFCNVRDLTIRGLTIKDPESFGVQLGRIHQFTVEDITFDYNLLRRNMDGVHLNGSCSHGRIANLKGTTNDDLVALNADDCPPWEMSRGPISHIVVDTIFSENGYTAVRLLSHGSPVSRIKLANVFGTYRYNVASFTSMAVHPGEPSTFDDISIDGVFCSKSSKDIDLPPDGPPGKRFAPIRIDAPAVVSALTIRDYHRTEAVLPADDIHIEPGATIDNLVLSDVTLVNRCGSPINLLHNRGTIGNLGLTNVYAKAGDARSGGFVLKNDGSISRLCPMNVSALGFELGYET